MDARKMAAAVATVEAGRRPWVAQIAWMPAARPTRQSRVSSAS